MAIGRLRQLSNSTVLKCVLTGFTLMFLVGAVCAPDRNELFAGLMRILGRSAVLTKDYFFLELAVRQGITDVLSLAERVLVFHNRLCFRYRKYLAPVVFVGYLVESGNVLVVFGVIKI